MSAKMKLYYLIRPRCLPVLLACAGLGLLLSTTAMAATTTNVTVGNNFFSPANVTINAGDTVKWNWSGSPHSSTSTSTPVLWDSGIQGVGSTFTHMFPSAGSFPYKCVVHFGQTGNITVQAAAVNVPPTVAISSPANGATFAAPWSGSIKASASDTDDTVSKIDFFAGQTLLGTVLNPSGQVSVAAPGLAAGNYMLKAVATDSRGATNVSAGVSVTVVTPSPIVLSSPQRLSPSSFQFSFSADAGLSYVIQRSDNLPGWTPIQTNTATGASVLFLDTSAAGPLNFYSVTLQPNP
jgi:plastocyanin